MTRFTLAAVATLACLVATPGHAQFGKLKNMVKKSAGDKAGEAAAAQVPPRQVDALPANLTEADLDKAIAGFNAEIAAAPTAQKEADRRNKDLENQRKQYERDLAAYEKKRKEYDACRERIDNDPKLKAENEAAEKKFAAMNDQAEAEIDEKEMEAIAMRVKPAMERQAAGKATAEDQKAIAEFQAMVAKMSNVSSRMMAEHGKEQERQEAIAKRYQSCGLEPKRPESPPSTGHSPESVMMAAGAAAGGGDTWANLREYAIMSANLRVTTKGRSQSQADSMNQKLDQIQQLTVQMRKSGIPL